jgi:septum formation protein
MQIVLASASPRRERLLLKLVKRFKVAPANVDERMKRGESFSASAVRLAALKARKAAKKHKSALVIGADTIAYLGRRNCRKTNDKRVADGILRGLSGKTHSVVTGVAVLYPEGKMVKYSVLSRVRMKRMGKETIAKYLKTGDWKGRAGSYDASGKYAGLVVAGIMGERENVAGLPVARLRKLLKRGNHQAL